MTSLDANQSLNSAVRTVDSAEKHSSGSGGDRLAQATLIHVNAVHADRDNDDDDALREVESRSSAVHLDPSPASLASAAPSTAAKPPATPLPRKQVAVLGMVLFAETFSQLVIFPFLPFMVHDFFPALEDEDLGYYAGYLGMSPYCLMIAIAICA